MTARTTHLFSETEDCTAIFARWRRANPDARLWYILRIEDNGMGLAPIFPYHWEVRWAEPDEGAACEHGLPDALECVFCGPQEAFERSEDAKLEAWRERG